MDPGDKILYGPFWQNARYARRTILLELKENIRQKIKAIDVHILQRVMDSTKKRIADCIQNGGGHLSIVI
jgi:hypothetical protein